MDNLVPIPTILSRKCSRCGSKKRLVKYNKRKIFLKKKGFWIFRQYYFCDKCNTERAKKYRETTNGKNKVKEAVGRYEKAHKERQKTWWIAHKYNPKTKPCEICHKLLTHRHHPDINKPAEIVFLCAFHHKQIHRSMKV